MRNLPEKAEFIKERRYPAGHLPEEMEGTYGTVWEFAGHSDIA